MNAQTQITAPSQQSVGLLNLEAFELSQRIAKMLSSSTLVPEQYRATIQKKAGKDQYGNQLWREEANPNGLSNCVIALNMSNRMGADPLMVMQNLYLVNGRPSWSSQFIMAGINNSGKFSALRFTIEDLGEKEVEYSETVWENRQKKTITKTLKVNDFSCVAWAIEKETGERLESSKITIEMAVKEGWYTKDGSKWQTMAEQMLRYRAASFFGRVYAPELLMGLRSVEEEQDRVIDVTPENTATVVNASDFKHIKNLILKAKSMDALEELESSIYALSDESERNELIKFWNAQADKYKVVDVEVAPSKKPETVKEEAPSSSSEKRTQAKKVIQEDEEKYQSRLADLIERAEQSQTESEANALVRYTNSWSAAQREPLHKAIKKRIAELNAEMTIRVDPMASLKLSEEIKQIIADTDDVVTLENNVAKKISAEKSNLTPGHHQDVLTSYAERKEILSQGDIFGDDVPSDTPVDRAIARINKCQTQDEINQVWEEIENDPYLSRALTAEDRKAIEQAADCREAEITG